MRLTSLFGGAGRPALCKRQAKTRCPPLNVPSASIAQQRRIYRCPRNKSGTLLKNSPRHRHSARRAWLPAIVYHRPSPAAKCFGALCANLRRPNRKKPPCGAGHGRPAAQGGVHLYPVFETRRPKSASGPLTRAPKRRGAARREAPRGGGPARPTRRRPPGPPPRPARCRRPRRSRCAA